MDGNGKWDFQKFNLNLVKAGLVSIKKTIPQIIFICK